MADVSFTGSVNVNGKYVSSYSIAENAGTPAAARVLLKDASTSGTLMADIRLAASDSKTFVYSPPLYFPSGVIAIQVSSGTARGDITYA